MNHKPIIGIFTQPSEASEYSSYDYSYIASNYVEYFQTGGARVVPILWDYDEDKLTYLFNRINGLVFTGGVFIY